MISRPVFLFLISLEITCLQSNQSSIIVSDKNDLRKINSQLHSLTNNIFKLLNLGKEFSKNDKVKVLLTMHNDLKKLDERRGKIYKSIRNMSNFTDKQTDEVSFTRNGLVKVFEDIITEETDRFKNFSLLTTSKTHETLQKTLGRVINEMLDEIFSVDSIIMPSVTNRVSKDKDIKKHTATTFSRRSNIRNIKIWHPPLSIELNNTRRLYKGKKTRIKEFPFLVSIHVMNEFMCAGSIISKDLVLTAATCLQMAYGIPHYSNSHRSIFTRVGSDYTKRSGELIPVTDIYFHPEFDPVSLKNNLVIVKLMQRPRNSWKRKVKRIQYDRSGVNSDEIDVVTVLGWGDKSNEHRASYQMQKVSIAHLDMYDIETCKEIYSQYYVTDNNFCAGFENKGGGACNKDVGGPAVVRGELIGIISFGPPVCGMSDAPTVFTRVGHYIHWINHITRTSYQNMRDAKIPHLQMSNSIPPVMTPGVNIEAANKVQLTGSRDEKLDEIHLLQEILQEMIFTNDSVLDYILYGDLQTHDNKVNDRLSNTNGKFHQLLSNNILHTIDNHKTNLRNEHRSSSYEDSDIEVKVLESLVHQTQSTTEFTTATNKRFSVNINNGQQQHTVNADKFVDITDKQNNIDLSSYYEDDEMNYDGLKIQDSKMTIRQNQIIIQMPATKEMSRYQKQASTEKMTKKINFEDFRHVMFKLTPLKESRSIITIDNKDSTVNKAMKNTGNKNGKNENKSNTHNDKRVMEIDVPLGRAVAISDEDYGSEFESSVKKHFNKRKKDDNNIDRDGIYWKFRN